MGLFRDAPRTLLTALLFVSICLTAACQSPASPTFVIPIPVEDFTPNTSLEVNIWSAAQLDVTEKQSNCVIAHDVQSQTDTVHCPEGVDYQQVTPERFSFPIRTINSSITLTSTSVKVGEKYQISIGGKSKDDCNSTSAFYAGVAASARITLTDLRWGTTVMWCEKKP